MYIHFTYSLVPMKKYQLICLIGLSLLTVLACKRNEPVIQPEEPKVVDPEPPCFFPPCVTDYRIIDSDPAWSPDGKQIVYFHGDKTIEKTGLYIINTDGTDNKLWHKGITISRPSWSPDGQWITFSESAQIWKKNVSGGQPVQLTTAGRNFFPTWSPDGNWIAYDSSDQTPNGMNFIWKMGKDGSNKQRIAYDLDNGEIRMPHWGGDHKIVHIRYVAPLSEPEIFTMDADGGNVKRVTNNTLRDYYPKISIQGKIIYTSQTDGVPPKLWMINSDGTNLHLMTSSSAHTGEWSPDGKRFVYTDARLVSGRLWMMDADGTNSKQLTFETNFK